MSVRRLNHAVLYVREVHRSVGFYTEVLGLGVRAEMPGRAAFLRASGSLNDHDLALFSVGPDAPGPEAGRVGLYHLAWEVGTLGELVAAHARLVERGALVGASDHLVALSLYGKDPDGIEFEVMWRVPRADWPGPDQPDGLRPLDLAAALERWGPDQTTGAAAGSAT
ncbi:VOC family protein [Streptomyces angustmyceticus]|uniref:Glyoxalase n=1 Tax=Streptomyces angustmyceticus TaxID=285578 RepID=A0A5J4L4B1_9ACTN|nr:VOC family protein [Streptomyces angustmyceticus]UAL69410.1 VOC family protein [Streptomyces angustmyceticus]GES29287.1 glyoxalase [Streptomyces angustmyceticus]